MGSAALVQCLAGRKSNSMHKAIKAIPGLVQIDEQLLDVVIAADIALKNQFATEFLGQIQHSITHTFSLIGEGQFRALAVHGYCHTVSNGAGTDHAGNQDAFIRQESHVVSSFRKMRRGL
jgi:hypothetical protein